MIERDAGDQILVCDECGDHLSEQFPQSEFRAMIAHAKTDGWSIRPDRQGGWWHTCADCSGASETPLERARRLLG